MKMTESYSFGFIITVCHSTMIHHQQLVNNLKNEYNIYSRQ